MITASIIHRSTPISQSLRRYHFLLPIHPHFHLFRLWGGQCGGSQLPILPGDVHRDVAARAQTFHRACGPGLRQRREQLDFAGVALQQHLGDAGGAAKVAVNLERRVGVEHVRVGAVGADQEREDLVGVSPSWSRAQRQSRQAMAQPVASSPRISSDRFTAAASSGVPRREICALGKRP